MKTTELAHFYWPKFLKAGGTCIDATVGNGHDLLYLAKLMDGNGQIAGYDIQSSALTSATALMERHLSEKQRQIVRLHPLSHIHFLETQAQLIVYNLGYLPGGDKQLVTRVETTLQSVQGAMQILEPGGCISLTCYVGHEEGAREEEALLKMTQTLSPHAWSVLHHRFMNRQAAPSLLLLMKAAAPS